MKLWYTTVSYNKKRGDIIKKAFVFIYFLIIVVVFTASDYQVKVVENSVPTTTEATTEEYDEKEVSDEEEVIVITADVSQMAREIRSTNNRVEQKSEDTKEDFESVVASFYGKYFHGRTTASGEKYNMNDLTAAHKTLPLGTVAKVTNVENNKSVVVRINDRGPYIEGREIDLSQGSFAKMGNLNKGLLKVNIEVLELGNNKYVKSSK